MNFFTVFEERVSKIFESAPQDFAVPISFKKLAKAAGKQLEKETYTINGTETAPALFTILVSSQDDTYMQAVYPNLIEEILHFITALAERKGYVFIGEPLIRFMVDPSLKAGKFAIFAENVDKRALRYLRDEENQYMQVSSAMLKSKKATSTRNTPTTQSEISHHSVSAQADEEDLDAGLDVIPESDSFDFLQANPAPVQTPSQEPIAVPQTQRRSTPLVNSVVAQRSPQPAGRHARHANTPVAQAAHQACSLRDNKTGKVYTIQAPSAIIGRERTAGGVVLRDPNISRQHAEIAFDGKTWRITDLDSTNGTLVNDREVHTATLRNGDIITLGLIDFEFEERA